MDWLMLAGIMYLVVLVSVFGFMVLLGLNKLINKVFYGKDVPFWR